MNFPQELKKVGNMSQKSIKLNGVQLRNFIEELTKLDITPKRFPGNTDYELIRFKQNEKFLVVYKNGTILKKPDPTIDKLIERIISDNLNELYKDFDLIIGSDEVGKGEWYGPLITVATCIKKEDILKFQKIGIRDSKDLKKNQIISIFKESNKIKFQRHSVTINPQRLNELWKEFTEKNQNYNDLIAWEHQRAILDLLKKIDISKRILIIIDKFDVEKVDKRLKNLQKRENIKIVQISKGESHIPVALSSIIAKNMWYSRIEEINRKFNISLPKSSIDEIEPHIVGQIGKLFFKNVRKIVNAFFLKNNLENLLLTKVGRIELFDEKIKNMVLEIFQNDKKIYNYLSSAYKFNSEIKQVQGETLNSKDFIQVIENEEISKNEINFLKEKDPDFLIKRFIVHQLEQKLDEIDNIDFKYCLKPVERIVRTIAAFCNRYILTRTDSFIVFGVKDIKSMPDGFSIKDRIINLKKMFKESKVITPEQFQKKINSIVEKHLTPNPDTCYSVKSLNLKSYGPFKEICEIIIIHVNNFNLDTPIHFEGEVYIRKNGEDKRATHEELEQLMKQIYDLKRK